MSAASRYCNLWRIDPASDRTGYKRCFLPLANDFFQSQGLSEAEEDRGDRSQQRNLQTDLLSRFQAPAVDTTERAQAGLCLRCYVSEPILNACRKIDHLFGDDRSFTYRDLLPFVLNDDGKTLMVLDSDGKTYLTLDPTGKPQTTAYQCFSLQILRTFKPNAQSSMSLDNWTYLQTKQNPELKNFLSEFGFKQLSDWALLNRTRSKQLQQLAERNRHLIAAFHAVYRRDRHQQHQGTKRCLDPTTGQLQEMVTYLKARNITIQPNQLITELRRVALQLRQFDLWSHREPLEVEDPETGDRLIRSELPQDIASEYNVEQQEQQEMLEFFHKQLQLALVHSIKQAISDRITYLKKSKGYAAFADRFIPGLHLYYSQGIALKEIADLLKMSGWAQARRVLNPGELINIVRTLTIRQVLDQMLKKAEEKGLTALPPQPDYLENLAKQIEALADAEIFQEAFEEIQAGKNRLMKSVYAQQLCFYLEECTKVTQGVS
ncbi:MAG: hypothetical protein PX636_05065 [Microcystis sp. M53598_WE2]|jgi:hypothetical protein|uniref:hypothetical protein n=1 Tax=Microcystis sp. M53598_WE2 TaxID=3030677 RepID=UPI002590F015|nr:hypothetical protein [Microcystis sp. M53598_WE2]MDJ0670361.1 hypothetical protein [Microcystis sp. M53598_WE2]